MVTPSGATPLTVPERAKVEAVEEAVVEVVLPQDEVFSTPKVPHPEPQPERSAATESGTAAKISFVCVKEVSISSSWSSMHSL
jgi:hypothetical protein